MATRQLRTTDLARAVGLSAQQVRNYEAWGFLPPAGRNRAGYRLYTPRHLAALRAARLMIAGYGWRPARAILAALHGGDLDAALALVDARHAEIDRQRGRVAGALDALRAVAERPQARPGAHEGGGLLVGEAARHAGVRVTALRFWEAQGLLSPARQAGNRYRRYDARQLRRLRLVALLRAVGYGFDTIRAVLDELGADCPDRALEAIARRREELAAASRAGIEATVAFWNYATSAVSDGES